MSAASTKLQLRRKENKQMAARLDGQVVIRELDDANPIGEKAANDALGKVH